MNNYPANEIKRGKKKLSTGGKTATEAEEENTAHCLWKVMM